MKVLAVNTSPRKNGNTSIILNEMSKILKEANIETEIYNIPNEAIRGCTACMTCFKKQNMQCITKDDCLNDVVAKMAEADGLILGSPTYFADVNAEMKAIIERVGFVNRANGNFLRRKPACGVSAVRRGGANRVFDTFNHFFLINEMIVPGSVYWNFVFGREIGEILNDDEGMNTIRVLAENMGWLLRKLHS
jgi:multimeric flavodoxin WrbA